MDEILAQIFQVGFFAAMIRIATPLLFATLGELFAERSGVLNLGIEGIMLLSAMTGFTAAYFTGSLWLGVAAAMLTGAIAGALMGLLTVTFGLSQHVSGLGLTLLCSGLAFFFYRVIFQQPSSPPHITAFETVPIPLLSDILPVVDHFGLRVMDAQLFEVTPADRPEVYIESLRILLPIRGRR